MISLSIVLSFISVWCLYATANRTDFVKTGIHAKLNKNSMAASVVAILLYVLSGFILVWNYGMATGIIASFTLWTLMSSLITLFTPFPKFKTFYICLIVVFLMGLEICLFI